MSFTTLLHIAFKNLLVQKRRTFLTTLGIIIGIFAVILVMSVGAGAQSIIVSQIATRGTDQIAILAGASEEDGPPAQAMGIMVTTLTREDGEALLNAQNVTHLKTVNAYISGNKVLSWKGAQQSVTFTGTLPSYAEVENVTIADGAFFTIEEEKSGARVMVLGSSMAEEIFGNSSALNQTVTLGDVSFRVVGVMEPKGSSPFEDVDHAALVPLSVAQDRLLGVRHVSFLRAKVSDEQYLDQSVEEVRQTLLERHGEEDFSIRNISDALDIILTVTNAIRYFLVAIAAIALFVGGVGVMNIMLIAVKEKTKEIGLRKAAGARDSDILRQFLIETVVITLLGGVVGLVAGVVISLLIALVVNSLGYSYTFVISLPAVLVSLGTAACIGLVFGIVPARRASKLDPIVALHYE